MQKVRTIAALLAAMLVARVIAAAPAGVSARVVGHQDCPAGTTGGKIDDPVVGSTVTVNGVTVTVTAVKYVVADSDEIVALQYESDGDVRYVIVKGGKDTIRYPGNDYSGAPVWYRAPTNENDEFPRQHHELSYVQFCVSDA